MQNWPSCSRSIDQPDPAQRIRSIAGNHARIVSLGAFVSVMLSSGCVVRQPAAPVPPRASPVQVPDDAWPERFARIEESIFSMQVEPREQQIDGCEWSVFRDHPPSLERSGRDWIFAYGPEASETHTADEVIAIPCAGPHGQGCVHHTTEAHAFLADRAWSNASELLVFCSNRQTLPNLEAIEGDLTDPDLDHLTFSISMPLPSTTLFAVLEPTTLSARGLVVHLSGLGGWSSQETAMLDELRDRGWAVLTSSRTIFGNTARNVTLRLEGGTDQCGATLAGEYDDLIAEWAFAVEAALDHLRASRPDLPTSPIVGIGCSAGALCLPATMVRGEGAFDAAVFVAGGAPLVDIARRTSLRSMVDRLGFGIKWMKTRPDAEEWAAIRSSYLEHTRLDPYACAPALAGLPLLTLHAPADAVVPSSTGDALHERLGRPERWSYWPLGHFGLFAWLPTQSDAIADWLDARVSKSD